MRISDWSSDVCSSDLRHQQFVELRGVLVLAIAVGDVHHILLDSHRADLGAEMDVQALLLELTRRDFGDVCIGSGEEVGQGFEYGNFAAQPAPHAAELKPRSDEHTSELQSLMRLSYAAFCLQPNNRKSIFTFILPLHHSSASINTK